MSESNEHLGKLLVAIPNTAHTEYIRGIMLVNSDWSRGFTSCMINRPIRNGMDVGSVFRNMGIDYISTTPIFYGGPDDSQRIQFVHSLDWQCSSTKLLNEQLGITGEVSIMSAIAAGQGPQHWRCIMGQRTVRNMPGYPNSLDGELSGLSPWEPGHRWLVIPGAVDTVFKGMGDEQWLEAINLATKLEVSQWF